MCQSFEKLNFSLTQKIFREINTLGKTLLSRIFRQTTTTENKGIVTFTN